MRASQSETPERRGVGAQLVGSFAADAHDCSDCFRLERIAGWALHPLESAALSRRTPIAAIH